MPDATPAQRLNETAEVPPFSWSQENGVTLAHRLQEADREWQFLRRTIHQYVHEPNALAGTSLYLGLARVLRALSADDIVANRMIAQLEAQIRAEFPPQTGRLL